MCVCTYIYNTYEYEYIYIYVCMYMIVYDCMCIEMLDFFQFKLCTPQVSEVSVSSYFSLSHWSGDMVVTRLWDGTRATRSH